MSDENTVDQGTCIYCGDTVSTRSNGKTAASHVDWGPEDTDQSWGTKPCTGTGRYVQEVRSDDKEVIRG